MIVRCVRTCMEPGGGKIIQEGETLDIPEGTPIPAHFVSLDQEAVIHLEDRYKIACQEEKKLIQQLEQTRRAKGALETEMAAKPKPVELESVVAPMAPDHPSESDGPAVAPMAPDDLDVKTKSELIKIAADNFQETLLPESRKGDLISAIRSFQAQVEAGTRVKFTPET